MARWTIKNVRFAGVSACMPKHVVKTADLPLFNKEHAALFYTTDRINTDTTLSPTNATAQDTSEHSIPK